MAALRCTMSRTASAQLFACVLPVAMEKKVLGLGFLVHAPLNQSVAMRTMSRCLS